MIPNMCLKAIRQLFANKSAFFRQNSSKTVKNFVSLQYEIKNEKNAVKSTSSTKE